MYKVFKNFTEGERRYLGFILKYFFALTSHNYKNPLEYTKNVTPGEKTLWSHLNHVETFWISLLSIFWTSAGISTVAVKLVSSATWLAQLFVNHLASHLHKLKTVMAQGLILVVCCMKHFGRLITK